MVPRIVVKWGRTSDIRFYHVTLEISESPSQTFWRPLRDTSERPLKETGEIGSDLIRRIFAIQGVAAISIVPYSLKVEKGSAFKWDEVEAYVLGILSEILMSHFGTQEVEIHLELSEEFPSKEEEPEEDEEVEL
ncbi:MAG: NifU N-terminal domain-containing protein [Candidatus Marinimicrobia bacterium]|nr:NifU N-terminal domain-containing protein [Candidatus Neomarinimicrobiota bacterium]